MADLGTAFHARSVADAGIAAIIAKRLYPVAVPQGAVLPYGRYQVISDPRPEHLKGYHASRTVRVQVDCFAETYAEARALAEAFVQAFALPATIAGVKFNRGKAEGPRDLGEDVQGKPFIHRASLDLLLEHRVI